MISNERRQEIEKELVTKIVEYALGKGLSVGVWNGGPTPEVRKCIDKEKILKGLFQCDVESIAFFDAASPSSIGYIDFVYGNDGYDVVADFVGPYIVDEIVESIQPLVDQYEKEAA